MTLKVFFWIVTIFVITYFSGVLHLYYNGTKEHSYLDSIRYLNYTQYVINIFAAVFYYKIATRYSLVKVILISIVIGLASLIVAYTVQEILRIGASQFFVSTRFTRHFARSIGLALIMPTLYVNIFVAVSAYIVLKERK